MTYDQLWESIKEPLVKHYDESDILKLCGRINNVNLDYGYIKKNKGY